jgi:hypothetical protein
MKNIYRKPVSRTRDQVLAAIEKLGKEIAPRTYASYWAAEDREYAKTWVPRLQALRNAYSAILRGANVENTLKAAIPVIGGIEGNYLGLIVSGLSFEVFSE